MELNDDCLEKNFDYLALNELAAVGRTNKQLNRVAGEFFKNNFCGRIRGQGGNIYAENAEIKLNCFSNFVQSVFMQDGNLQMFQPNRFQSLKEIEFYNGDLRSIDCITNVLSHVETLKFIFCNLNGDIHGKLLSHCEKLKRLYVHDSDPYGRGKRNTVFGTSNNWLTKNIRNLNSLSFSLVANLIKSFHFLS